MHHVIELVLDPEAESQVRSVWRSLAEQRITSGMLDFGCRPHVTTMSSTPFQLANLQEELASLAQSVAPFEITFSHIGIFRGNALVLFLGVTHTAILMTLQRRLFELVSPVAEVLDFARPDVFVFHCTLGPSIQPQDLPRAVQLVHMSTLPAKALVNAFEVVEYGPRARTLQRFAFGMRKLDPLPGAGR